MTNTLAQKFLNDEAGFIVSAELVLVATIAVLSLVVGLSEISLNVNNELEDVASAFGKMNQSYKVNGLCSHGASTGGSTFTDAADFCDTKNIQTHAGLGE